MSDNISNAYLNTRAQREQPKVDDLMQRLNGLVQQEQDPKAASAASPAAAAPVAAPSGQPDPNAKSPGFMQEAKRAVVGGVRDAGQSVLDLIDDVGRWSDNNLIDLRAGSASFGQIGGAKAAGNEHKTGELHELGVTLPVVAKNETTVGNLGRSVTQFLVPFMGAMKAVRVAAPVLKAGMRGATAGAITDFAAFDPHDKRLSNLILDLTDNNPTVGKPILQYLAADPKDSNAEGRFKNMLEGLGIGASFEGLFLGIKAVKAKWVGAGQKPMEVLEQHRVAPEEAAAQATAAKERIKPEDLSLRQQVDALAGVREQLPRDKYQRRLDAVAAFKNDHAKLSADSNFNLSSGAPKADAQATADAILQKPGVPELKLADENAAHGLPFEHSVTPAHAADTLRLVEDVVAKNPEKVHHVFMDASDGGIVFSKTPPSPSALPLDQTIQTVLAKQPSMRTAEDLVALRAYRQLQEAAFPGLIKSDAVKPHEIHPIEVVGGSRKRQGGFISPTVLANMAAAHVGGIAGFNSAEDGASWADKLGLAGMGMGAALTGGRGVSKLRNAHVLKNGQLISVEHSLEGKPRTQAQSEIADLLHTPNPGDFYLHAKDEKGNVLGWLSLSKKDGSKVVEPRDVTVLKEHRRKGVASAMYEQARRMGYDVVESPYQTADGKALRSSMQKRNAEADLDFTKQAADNDLDFTKAGAEAGYASPALMGNMASASVGGLAGWNSAEPDATFAERLGLAGLGALGGLGVKVGAQRVFTKGERALAVNADPIVRSLATKEGASIAPTAGSALKPRPTVQRAKVEQIVQAAKTGGLKEVAQAIKESDFNFDHIDTAAEVKDTIDAFSSVFEKELDVAKHGTQSHAQLAELADELGAGLDSLKGLYQNTDNLGARIFAHRALLTASAEKVTNLARMVSGQVPMTDGLRTEEAILALRKHVAMHATIQSQMKGVQTEVARALGQFRLASSSVDLAKNEVNSLIDALGGHEANMKFAQDLSTITDPKKLNEALRMGAMAKTRGALTESIVMGKLWSPVTHVANAVGNLITVVGSVAERATASAIGKYVRNAPDAIEGAEVKAQMFGLLGGIKDALHITSEGLAAARDAAGSVLTGDFKGAKQTLADNGDEFGSAWQALATGQPAGRQMLSGTVEDVGNRISAGNFGLDPSKLPGILADALGTLTTLPGRPLAAADELFFAMHYRGELRAQAYRKARQQGLEGDALVNEIARLMTDPDPVMRSQAVRAGQDGTFTTPLTGSQAGMSRLVNSANVGPIPAGRLVVPFIRTPMNIMNYVGRRNPLTGFMAESYKADIAAGGARADMAHARIVLGSTLLMVGATMASEMEIAGTKVQLHGGGDFKKGAEKLGNILPYSLQIGDKFYAFNRLDPFGMFLGLSADFRDILGHMGDEGTDAKDIISASVLSLGRNLTSKSYLQGLIQGVEAFSEAARGNVKKLGRYMDDTVAGALPFSSAFNTARKVDDPVQREVWTMMDAVKNKIPGYSKELPPMRNLFGEPIKFHPGLGPDIASPIQTSDKVSDKAASEIARLNVDLDMPPRSIAGKLGSKPIDLTPQQYDMYTKVAGENFKSMMTQAVNDPSWKDIPEDPGNSRYTDAKELHIRTFHNKAKEIAFAHLLEHDPKFAAAFMQNIENAGAVLTGSGKPKLPLQ